MTRIRKPKRRLKTIRKPNNPVLLQIGEKPAFPTWGAGFSPIAKRCKCLVHDGDGAIGEIDDLFGNGTEEMRIQSRQSAGTDHQMACVTGSCDQSLRRGDMEGVRFDLEIVGNAGRGNLHRIEQLVKNAFRTLLTLRLLARWRSHTLR